jgi:hypothetical protein
MDGPTCGRPACVCEHSECDRGWIDRGADMNGHERVAPCLSCRPEYEPTGMRTATNRDAWLAMAAARRRPTPSRRRRRVAA